MSRSAVVEAVRRLGPIVGLSLVLAAGAGAQTFGSAAGGIEGRILDQNGTPLATVAVRIASDDGAIRFTLLTDRRGFYASGSLPAGVYALEAFKDGFASAVIEQIDLDAGEVLRHDLALEAGRPTSFSLTSAPVLDSVQAASASSVDLTAPDERLASGRLGRLSALLAGSYEEPPSGFGSGRIGAIGSWPGRASVAIDGQDVAFLSGALWLDASGLFFDRVQARGPVPSVERPAAPGGWIDLVTRSHSAPLAGALRLEATEADTVVLPACTSVGCVAEGRSSVAGLALGGTVADGRLQLFAGGAREWRRDGDRDLDLERDAGAVRLRWSVGSSARWSLGASFYGGGLEPSLGHLTSGAGPRPENAGPWPESGGPRPESGGPRPENSELVTATLDGVSGGWSIHGDLGELDLSRAAASVHRRSVAVAGSRRVSGGGEHAVAVGGRRIRVELERSSSDLDALWLNDRWRLGRHLTVSLGARYERSAFERPGVGEERSRVAPWIGAAYDVYGDGTWKVYTHYGRSFVELLPPGEPVGAVPLPAERAGVPSLAEAVLGTEQIVVAGLRLYARVGRWRLEDSRFAITGAEQPEGRYAGVGASVDLFRRWAVGGGYTYTQLDGAACGRPACSSRAGAGLDEIEVGGLERPHRLELHGHRRFGHGVVAGAVLAWMAATPEGAPGDGGSPGAYARLDLTVGYERELGVRPLVLGVRLGVANALDRRALLRGGAGSAADPVTELRQEQRSLRIAVRLGF